MSEKAILSSVRHPFIVNLCGTYQDPRCLFMVLEFVSGGELFSHLRKAGRFSNETTRFFGGYL